MARAWISTALFLAAGTSCVDVSDFVDTRDLTGVYEVTSLRTEGELCVGAEEPGEVGSRYPLEGELFELTSEKADGVTTFRAVKCRSASDCEGAGKAFGTWTYTNDQQSPTESNVRESRDGDECRVEETVRVLRATDTGVRIEIEERRYVYSIAGGEACGVETVEENMVFAECVLVHDIEGEPAG